MANIDQTCSNILYKTFLKLQNSAELILNRYFDHVVILQPGIKIDSKIEPEKNGKVYSSEIYKHTLNSIIWSQTHLLFPDDKIIVIPAGITNLESRLNYILDLFYSLNLDK
jgi:hypothetical protein